eukprot:366379-Chlamydomonas_euryale.AAC.5
MTTSRPTDHRSSGPQRLMRRPLCSGTAGKKAKQAVVATDSGGTSGSMAQPPPPGRKVVVFASSCAAVELLHLLLGDFWEAATGSPLLPAPVLKLHGDMAQPQRTAAFLKFNTSEVWNEKRCNQGMPGGGLA